MHSQPPGLRGGEKASCILDLVALLRSPGEAQDIEDTVFECHDNHGKTTVLDMDEAQKGALNGMIADGTIVPGKTPLDISQATKTNNGISLPPGKINIKKNDQASESSGRNLAATVPSGTKYFLAVKVSDANNLQLNDTPAEISDNIFGTGQDDAVNLKSQLGDCSFGELDVSVDYSAFSDDYANAKDE
eukprot:14501451-Ditylum_brightwellii.AAC.2